MNILTVIIIIIIIILIIIIIITIIIIMLKCISNDDVQDALLSCALNKTEP